MLIFDVFLQTHFADNYQVHRRCGRCQYEALYRLDASFTSVGLFVIHLGQIFTSFLIITRYIALFAWTLAVWVSFNVLIDARQGQNASAKSTHIISLISKLLFSFFLCAAVLLFEKFAIQWIAGKFHERSYAGTHCSFLEVLVRTFDCFFFHQNVSPFRSLP